MTGRHYNIGTDDGFSFIVERQDLGTLLSLLKSGQSVLITGGRKIGKTVLLQQVKRYFEYNENMATSVVVPIYQDLMSLTQPPTAARLFNALSYEVPPAVNALLKKRGVNTKCMSAPEAWKYDPSLEFTQYLKAVLDQLDNTVGRVTIIYLLDECEALLGSDETHALLGNLRALVGPQIDYRVKLAVTGFRDIKEYVDPVTGTSPFKNILHTLPLCLLVESEFDELLQPLLAPLPNKNRKELRDRIWNAAGGHPCVTQAICHLLMKVPSPKSFEAVCEEVTKLFQGMAFSFWVDRFNSHDHEVFRNILKDEIISHEHAPSVEFLLYCGVATLSNEKLLAPCGLFNLWYKRQFEGVNIGRAVRQADKVYSETFDVIRRADAACVLEANSSDTVAQVNSTGKTCALVMKGGGVKGLAYIGAIRELEKYYNFDWFIGTSAGAIAAVLFAAGYTTDELESILRQKDFRDFLDSPLFKLPINLIFKGGLHEARTFTTWLDKLIGDKIPSFEPLPLSNLLKGATVYASRRYVEALIFEKGGANNEKAASFAVRCSMSIPLVFIPQREQGLRVLDGGMRNNYPISKLLKHHPGTEFIGLYLGNYYEGMAKEPWILSEMLTIWTESVDIEALKEHGERTVLIDPRPIKTIDFNLEGEEKDFLLSVGKVAALNFLLKQKFTNGPTKAEVKEAEKKSLELKAKVIAIRAERKRRRWLKALLFLLLSLATVIFFRFIF